MNHSKAEKAARIDTGRRQILSAATACLSLGLGLGLSAVPQRADAAWFGRRDRSDKFDQALAYVERVSPARVQTYAGRCPDGASFRLRVATPIDPPRTVPVVLLAGASAVPVASYDSMMSTLAGWGYMVIAPEFSLREGEAQQLGRWRRLAEMRYACDQIFAVRATLGASAERMEPNLIAAWGHGDGSCVAGRLIGFDQNWQANSAFSDGRFRAAVVNEPWGGFPIDGLGNIGQAYARSSGSALIIAAPSRLPSPPTGSGVLGLGIEGHRADLAESLAVSDISSAQAYRASLAAMAATLIYFDWHLRGDEAAEDALNRLNQRMVEGISAPLALLKA